MAKPTYSASDGKRYTTAQIETRIRLAKALKLEQQFNEYGYNFCEKSGVNSSYTILDVSHNISVKEAKETGRAELCWDIDNMEILARALHQKKDKLNLKFNDSTSDI